MLIVTVVEIMPASPRELAMIVVRTNIGKVRDIVIREGALLDLWDMLNKRYKKEEEDESEGATGGEEVE